MKCIDAQRQLQHLLLEQQPGELLSEHLEHCPECLAFYQDHRLQERLQTFVAPEPRAEFLEQAMEKATRSPGTNAKSWAWSASLAASLLLVGLMFTAWLPENPEQSGQSSPLAISVEEPSSTEQQVQEVKILIVSDQDYSDAEISITLTDNLALQGYADQRELTWTTTLKEGNNLLTLPVQILNQGGQLQVSSRLGQQTHEVSVPLQTNQGSI
ncbi:hypothetical protein [Marinospirillum sp.]|uniref:hypothetical protein n=1 Tax=Marinospirillum sp. TaxID=2183934 RepID=UPI00384E6D22